MESVFVTDLAVHERYDLKGSWHGRRARKHGATRASRWQACAASAVGAVRVARCVSASLDDANRIVASSHGHSVILSTPLLHHNSTSTTFSLNCERCHPHTARPAPPRVAVDKQRGVGYVPDSRWPQFTYEPLKPGFREVRKDLDMTTRLVLEPDDAHALGAQVCARA
jgi:hypothetical protein